MTRLSRWMNAVAIVLPVVLLITVVSASQTHKGKRRYPFVCAGINVGGSTGADVQKLYGKGFFVKDEDHLGGRYYVDSKHTVTLHISMGTDNIVDNLEYQPGIHLGRRASVKILKQATTSRLDPAKQTRDGLFLGATAESILKKYSKPTQDRQNAHGRALKYKADENAIPSVIVYEAELRFRNNRLIYVSLYNGE